MAKQGLLDPTQIEVSLVVITLFIPCIANFFVMVKERGMKIALYMTVSYISFCFCGWWCVNLDTQNNESGAIGLKENHTPFCA